MLKHLLLLLLAPFVFGVLHDLSYLGEDVSWNVVDGTLTIRFVGSLQKNTWFSIGLESNGFYDAWTIYRDEAECARGCVIDASQSHGIFAKDQESSFLEHAIDISADEIGVEFSRRLNTEDVQDIQITPGDDQLFFWTTRQRFTAIADIDISSNIAIRKRIDFGDEESLAKRVDTYVSQNQVGDFLFEWAVQDDNLVGRMTAPTTGWVSIGFGKDPQMPGIDCIMASVKGANTVIQDSIAPDRDAPTKDSAKGGTEDAEVRASSEVGGKTTVAFRRKLVTKDANDQVIANENTFVHFAFAASDNFNDQHTTRGAFQANLFTGAVAAGGAVGQTGGIRASQVIVLVIFGLAGLWLIFRFLHKMVKKCRRKLRARNYEDSVSSDHLILDRKKSSTPNFIHRILHKRIAKTHINVEFVLIWVFYLALNIVALIIDERGRVIGRWGNALGSILIANAFLVAIPATRNSMLVVFWGIPFDRTILFHRFLGRWTFLVSTVHAAFFFFKYGVAKVVVVVTNRFGIVAWACMAIMIITSIGPIRRRVYSVFKGFHFFYILAYIFMFLHEEECRPYCIAVLVIILFDKCFRMVWGTFPVKAILATTKQNEVVHIRFRKHCLAQRLKLHRVGQYMFVNFPTINPLEWHPFSVSSGPDEATVEIHVKPLGRFTKKLMETVSQNPKHLWIRTDGPYGNLKFNYRRYNKLVLVAGGIGITPIISMLKDIYRYGPLAMNAPATHKTMISDVVVVWAIRNVEQFEWFRQEIAYFSSKSGLPGYPVLDMKIYVSAGNPGAPFFAGRPDVKNLVGNVAASLGDEAAMMAFVCGPEAMVSDTWDVCTEWKGEGTHIKFHKETFCF